MSKPTNYSLITRVVDGEGVPEMRQFGDLNPEDFQRHPVWIGCHGVDSNKPWYKDTDEEHSARGTERCLSPTEGMLLVRATLNCEMGVAIRDL
jgi:hypothetical protein